MFKDVFSCIADEGKSRSSGCVINIHTCREQKDCQRQVNLPEESAGMHFLKNLSFKMGSFCTTAMPPLVNHTWKHTVYIQLYMCFRHCSSSVFHSTLRRRECLTESIFWGEGLVHFLKKWTRKSLLLQHHYITSKITHTKTYTSLNITEYCLARDWIVLELVLEPAWYLKQLKMSLWTPI